MKLFNYSFFVVFILYTSFNFAMNEEIKEIGWCELPCVTIRDFKGKIITVDSEPAKKFELTHSMLHYSRNTRFPYVPGEGKESSFHDGEGWVDSQEYIPNFDFYNETIVSRTSDAIEPTGKVIKIVIDCANQAQSKSIKQKHFKSVLALADYFQVPRESYGCMALHLEECSESDPDIDKYMLEYDVMSVASLGFSVKIETDLQTHQKSLRLNNKGLHTLYGIHNFADDELEWLDISGNNLTRLDIVALKKDFPKLKYLHAFDNKKLKNLIVPSNLDDGFFLVLEKNPIQYISPFKAGQNGTISVSEGCLSEQAQLTLERAILPGFYDKRMHYPFFIKRIILGAGIGFIVGGFFGLGTFVGKKDSSGSLNNSSFLTNTGVRAGIYCATKFAQLQGFQFDEEITKDLKNTEWLAKWLGLGSMIVMPIALRYIPNVLNFIILGFQDNAISSRFRNFTIDFYGGYPVFKPTKIIYSKT